MITHSDNTATDLATEQVGADRVRALITEAGLKSIRIPDPTRRFYSYVLGAPTGVDLGWPGIEQANQKAPGALRPALNDVITLAGSARDFVSWYEQALNGDFFTKPETLTEFRRIQAMGMPAGTVPAGTAAYGKGGDFPFNGINSICLAGQMIVCGEQPMPVTFCFTVNWNAPDSEAPEVAAEFVAAISGILGVINAVQMRKSGY
jgi:beta-lactamase class A